MELAARRSTIGTTFCFLSLLLSFFFVLSTCSTSDMAEPSENSSPPADTALVYIVYTEKPDPGQEESHHLATLSAILGSDEAAKDSLIYVYKNAATGFSAKITPAHAEILKGKPGVLLVTPSQTLQLHNQANTMKMSTLQRF